MVKPQSVPPVSPSEPPQSNYSDQSFWDKLRQVARQAGRTVVENALTLYYAAQEPTTPNWAKLVIYSSLAYFILPTDAIPDFIPMMGYGDDLSALASAVVTVAMAITPEVKDKARRTAAVWFGAGETASSSDGPQAGDQVREIPIE